MSLRSTRTPPFEVSFSDLKSSSYHTREFRNEHVPTRMEWTSARRQHFGRECVRAPGKAGGIDTPEEDACQCERKANGPGLKPKWTAGWEGDGSGLRFSLSLQRATPRQPNTL